MKAGRPEGSEAGKLRCLDLSGYWILLAFCLPASQPPGFPAHRR